MGRSAIGLAAAAALSFAAAAQAQDGEGARAGSDWTFVAGLKVWSNRWSSWDVFQTLNENAEPSPTLATLSSNRATALIPQLGLRWKDWLFSLSQMQRTDYVLTTPFAEDAPGSRDEQDASIGYYLLPGLAATLGYKKVAQHFGTGYTWKGPIAGLNATAPLSPAMSVYATLGYGSMAAHLGVPDDAGRSRLRAGYLLQEAGLAWTFAETRGPRALTLTLGWRSQTVTMCDYAVGDATTRTDVRDITQGLTLGLVAAF